MNKDFKFLGTEKLKPIHTYKCRKCSIYWPGATGMIQAIFEVGKTYQSMKIMDLIVIPGGIEIITNERKIIYMGVPIHLDFEFTQEAKEAIKKTLKND